jgi:hypothetical protein
MSLKSKVWPTGFLLLALSREKTLKIDRNIFSSRVAPTVISDIIYNGEMVTGCSLDSATLISVTALSVGEEHADTGITPTIVTRSYIRLWITLMLFQPPLSHTSR